MVKGVEEQGSEILGQVSKLKGNFCSLEGQQGEIWVWWF